MTIDESISLLNSHFGKKFTKIYFNDQLPPFKMGKSKFSNKNKKEKIKEIEDDIKGISRDVKISDILGTNASKRCEEDLKKYLNDIKNNKIEHYSSYGRCCRKIKHIELEDTVEYIEYIQEEFVKYGQSVPISTYPVNKINIEIKDICRFANILKNKTMDFLFLEFYIQKKYNQKVEEYFNIGRQSVSDWRISNSIPEKRLLQFQLKEVYIDPKVFFQQFFN